MISRRVLRIETVYFFVENTTSQIFKNSPERERISEPCTLDNRYEVSAYGRVSLR